MLNKLERFARKYDMLKPGDQVVCAVSGGADSMALLWALFLLRDKLEISLTAAHFNHGLRGGESDRDEAFVRDFCKGMGIPFVRGSAQVSSGKKGLEAAARDARYAFLRTLPGKVATAHTANDNAETVLMHMVRGTGLKGLGGIAPVSGRVIRPMLEITRQEVLDFLEEYNLSYVTDSSNLEDGFLRNRLRHRVIPVLEAENPRFGETVSAMALRLREDEAALAQGPEDRVEALRQMPGALRRRALAAFLKASGVKEPEAEHIRLAEQLVFSVKPSAQADFPGDVRICRCYDRLVVDRREQAPGTVTLAVPGRTECPEWDTTICIGTEGARADGQERFSCRLQGTPVLRSRLPGDRIRLSGGSKSLKKLFIDHKLPAAARQRIPVLADAGGVLWVQGFGPNLDRLWEQEEAVSIEITYLSREK